ncbi:MAG: SAM-dependent chlorinase/fluorinase [Pyrinomonadaceae bacterium]|nr:SAM-dependent chlorinase/fluorinase [Pyrinomonadaceae bacterium]
MIIALLTDFGTQDYFVGALKGVILSINEAAKIIDITHEIEPQNIKSASFILASVYQTFPPQTIFVSVVDPGVGSARRAILVETDKYSFIAPDNGLLSFIFQTQQKFRVFELTNSQYFLPNVSQTFHGRDIFAPVAAWCSKGIDSQEFGKEVTDFVIFDDTRPKIIEENLLEAEIVHIDHFGNIVTNLKKEDVKGDFALEINGIEIAKNLSFYAEAEIGEVFTIWGSAGYLEIVANQNSASELLKTKTGEKIRLKMA